VLLTWAARREIAWTLRRVGEAGALLASLAVVSEMVFGGWLLGEDRITPGLHHLSLLDLGGHAVHPARSRDRHPSRIRDRDLEHAREIGPFAGNTPTESFLCCRSSWAWWR